MTGINPKRISEYMEHLKSEVPPGNLVFTELKKESDFDPSYAVNRGDDYYDLMSDASYYPSAPDKETAKLMTFLFNAYMNGKIEIRE
jgi:hypothetical protein